MNNIYSCLVDNKPLFRAQAFVLVTTLLANKVAPKKIFVQVIDADDNPFYKWLNDADINVVHVKEYDSRNKYCNKLSQLEIFEVKEITYDYLFLLDCDIAIHDLASLIPSAQVSAKIVDYTCPPFSVLETIFKEANVGTIKKKKVSVFKRDIDLSDRYNCNGGVYIIAKEVLSSLSAKWKKYATWCIDNDTLFTEKHSKHADQVGFSLAMHTLELSFESLDIKYNFPLHVPLDDLPNITPSILHYHHLLNEHMQLKNIGSPKVDMVIEAINKVVSSALGKELNNSMFWDFRYSLNPELGSGVGSRGEVLAFKKQLVTYVTYPFNTKSIIDVGCGDLELMKGFKFTDYKGLDVSVEALKICQEKRPDWSFLNKIIYDDDIDTAHLIMCFDVLIHQSDKKNYDAVLNAMFTKSTDRVLIGAYGASPQYESAITHYYSSILDEVNGAGTFNEVAVVGLYRDIVVVCATKHSSSHNRDILSEKLNIGFGLVERPDLLQYLVDVSRTNFGFYTSHFPRVYEYSWLLQKLESKKGEKVLDVGAGVCPLPLCLTNMGMKVTTVDLHKTTRDVDKMDEWNEWGFLDYSYFNASIESHNLDFSQFKFSQKFDSIYSISVIEHMPRQIRNKILKNAKRLLKVGGKLLLTIDMIPGTDNIWNFSEDKPVESVEVHGTITSFKIDLLRLGFEINEMKIQREIIDSRTDICYVEATLKKRSLLSKIFNY
ncbi:methyltransferase domain-containing protein [Patiriisocius sp. Uisw_017]|jgi:2-polyprenyl-3-methyl-5-hydroxy-6-metoxy-1,4-benzoquinol methylase|uniref:methyltransferase domain-containing protein n=1 Tax=Patiriisocius sp. Uisw_017 TaxID=3230968 RepID=UPI0039ED8983